MDIRNRVALITGGGTGLGRVISERLGAEGMRLAISYSKSAGEAEETVAALARVGCEARVFQADLQRVDEAKRLVSEVAASFGGLDLLIHNAATTRFIPFPDLDSVTEEAWDELFAVNTRAAFFLAQAAAPALRASPIGQIITTSSIAGLGTRGSSLPYCVTKAALIHLTRCLAVAMAPHVRVNSVAPGLLLTRWVAGFSEKQLETSSRTALLQKATDLGDVADAFVMLAKNGSTTGQVITVNAGLLDA